MRTILAIAGLTATAAVAAPTTSKIDELCGVDHVNEAVAGDVLPNPDGYYVRSIGVQLSHGDARIIEAVGDAFYLCTRTAATPDMEAGMARLLMKERRVRYLFVPVLPPRPETSG